MDLFLFGTLLHVPLLEVVSGDAQVADRITWAVRRGYRVCRVDGHVFPMMVEDADGVAEGMIVSGLLEDALARLDYYEKAFGYDRVDFVVLDANQQPRQVTAYVPEPDRWTPAEPWDRDGWIAQFGQITTLTAHEAMAATDTLPALEMGRLYPNMMERAASRLRAARHGQAGAMGHGDVQITSRSTPHRGFFNLEQRDLRFRRFDGAMSDTVNREVFVSVDCALVLPYDPVRDRLLLIEQFRAGPFLRDDPNPWMIEPIAGRIDVGEDPQDAARREAWEEARVEISDLHCVSAAYPSPASSTEHLYVYVGIADLPDGSAGIAGVASEAEDIRSHLIDWADFDDALNAGKYRLLPMFVAGHWLARNRARLRDGAHG